MTLFSTDFSEHPVASGLPTGWTSRWGPDTVASIESGGPISDRFLRLDTSATGNADRGFSYDAPGDGLTDVEVLSLTRFILGNSSRNTRMVVRGSGGWGGSDGYLSEQDQFNDTIELTAYLLGQGGSKENIASGVAAGFDMVANQWIWVRERVVGTEIKAKVWEFDTEEPVTGGPSNDGWLVVATDSRVDSGWVGVSTFYPDTNDVAWYSTTDDPTNESAPLPTLVEVPTGLTVTQEGSALRAAWTSDADEFILRRQRYVGPGTPS